MFQRPRTHWYNLLNVAYTFSTLQAAILDRCADKIIAYRDHDCKNRIY